MELNRRYELEAPQGSITETGIVAITVFIQNQRGNEGEWLALNPQYVRYYIPALPENWQWVWLVAGRGEYVGTFPKRVSKYLYKEHGIKAPKSFLTELGNIARRHTEDHLTYRFDFVNRFDWDAGDFGDGHSCYWDNNSAALEMLRDNGGLAVRFFDDYDGSGIARAWLVEIEVDLYIVFNGYGFEGNPTLIIARIFAQFVSASYKRINLFNNGRSNGTLWINGGIGYVVGAMEAIDTISRHDFEWGDYAACESCGVSLGEEDIYYGANDGVYCENCFYEMFDTCEYCGEAHWREDIIYLEEGRYQYLCEHCVTRLYVRCHECDEWTHRSEARLLVVFHYCADCCPALI